MVFRLWPDDIFRKDGEATSIPRFPARSLMNLNSDRRCTLRQASHLFVFAVVALQSKRGGIPTARLFPQGLPGIAEHFPCQAAGPRFRHRECPTIGCARRKAKSLGDYNLAVPPARHPDRVARRAEDGTKGAWRIGRCCKETPRPSRC